MQQALIEDVLCPLGALFHCLSHYIVQVATHIFQIALHTYSAVVRLRSRSFVLKIAMHEMSDLSSGDRNKAAKHALSYFSSLSHYTTAFSCSGQIKNFIWFFSSMSQDKLPNESQGLFIKVLFVLKVMSIRLSFTI